MIKKIILVILLLIILAFGGLVFYVSTMDWNKYKTDIAEKFSELTGKDIDIKGAISVSLLPQPNMKARGVSIYNRGDKTNALASVNKMDMSVSLLSILSGTPDINSLSLSDAEIWIEQDENGHLNWSPSGKDTSLKTEKTNLRSLNLQNADIHYENKSADLKFDFKDINAEIQASAIDGPYRMDGNFIRNNDHFAIAIGIGSLSSLDGIETNFSISHPASESFLRFDGIYNPQEHNIKGDFSGGSKKPAHFVNNLTAMKLMNTKNEQELQFSSGVEIDKDMIKLSSFVTKYSDDIEGSGSLTYPLTTEGNKNRKIDLKYEFLNLDIRHFIPAVKAEYQKFKDEGGVYIPDTKFDIKADLAAKHVDINDADSGYLENVTLKANWKDNIFTIDEFYANGAGDTAISISGDLREENTRPKYFLKNSLISTDFLSFINSFGANLKSYVQSSYHNAKFDFSVIGDDSSFSTENAEFSMDKTKLNVDLSALFILENPNFSLKAVTENFNFDNYLPSDKEKQSFTEQLEKDFAEISVLKNWNYTIDFKADNAVFRSTPITSLAVRIRNDKGILSVDELSAKKVAGAEINISGIADLNQEALTLQNFNVRITSGNISDLISQTNFSAPSWKILKSKSFKTEASIDGTLKDFQINTNTDIDGITMEYSGNVKNESDIVLNGNLIVKTMNLGQFFEGINIESKDFPNKNSALDCNGTTEISADNFSYNNFNCLIGTSNYNGKIVVKNQDEVSNIEADINADEFNLGYLFDLKPSKTTGFNAPETSFDNTFISYPDLSRDLLDFSRYKGTDIKLSISAPKGILKRMTFENLAFKLTNKDNILKISEINTDYKKAHYTGELTFSYNNPESPLMEGNLEFTNADIGLVGGSIYMFNNGIINGKAAFESRGASVYEMFSTISGSIDMKVENLNFKGFNFAAIKNDISSRKYSKGLFQTIRNNLQQGETDFDMFEVTIKMKNGNLSVENLQLSNSSAKTDVGFDIDLKNWEINSKMIVSLIDAGDVPSFDVSLNGSLQKPSLEINIEDLVKHYDDYWKKIEEENKAQKEAMRKSLNEQMAEVQKDVLKVSEDVSAIAPQIESYKQKSKKEENILWYDSKLKEIGLINENLDAMKAKSHTPDYTADDISLIKTKTENYAKEISSWSDEISKRHTEDIDFRINKLLTDKSNIDIGIQNLKSEYSEKLNTYKKKLEKINKSHELSSNKNLKELSEQFEKLSDTIISESSALNEKMLLINTVTDSMQKDEVLDNADIAIKNLSDQYSTAKTIQKNIIDEIVETAEKLLDKDKLDKQKSSQENPSDVDILRTVNISNNTTENSEETGILKGPDDSDESLADSYSSSPKTQGVIVRSYDDKTSSNKNPTPSKSGILKEVDGAVKKASGTITIK